MRAIFLLLLLANLALVAYVMWQPSGGEPQLVAEQLNADQIRIIAPRAPAARTPRKPTCVDWVGFSADELTYAQRALEPLQLGERVSTYEVQVVANWWVYIAPLKNKAELDRKLAELDKLGVTEYAAQTAPGPMRFAISLGSFRSEEAASSQLENLQRKGVRSAKVGKREHRLTLIALRVRDPDTRVSARLAELQTHFPGTELKVLDCPP